MVLDPDFCNKLSELIISCDQPGTILFANTAAHQWSPEPLAGAPFTRLLSPDSRAKGERFLTAARSASPDAPTDPWELPLGDASSYQIADFRGYRDGERLTIIGEVEPPERGAMQRELLALTTELSTAQREQRSQNRQLKQALEEQHRLIETIQALSAPVVPIWDQVLLLPLVGHFDSHRADQVSGKLLEQAARARAAFVILDLSGIAIVDTAVANQLIQNAAALRLLGVQPILVGINPEIAQTIVNLGVQLPGFVVKSDLRGAMAYVLRQRGVA